jgi:hypothetical protein
MRSRSGTFLLLAALAVVAAARVDAALAIRMSSSGVGGTSTTCTTAANALNCDNLLGPADPYFSVQLSSGITNAPGGAGATLSKTLNIVATDAAIAAGSVLTLEVYAYNFTVPPMAPGIYTMTESVTANNPLAFNFGVVTGTGYLSDPNPPGPLFNTAGTSSGPATIICTAPGVGSGCGIGGAFFNTAASSGSVNVTGDFALTNVITVDPSLLLPGGAGQLNFTANLALTAVPEPTSVALFGGILLLTGTAIRRKLAKRVV